MRRRAVLAVAVAAVVVAGAAALVLSLRDDGGERRRARTELLSPPVPLQEERDEMVALVERGRGQTFHARYEVVGEPNPSFPRSVEIWRRDGVTRTDTETVAGSRVDRTATIRRRDGAVACRRTGTAPWSCREVAAPQEDLFGQAAADLAGAGLTARDGESRRRAASCFTIEADEQLELCFDRTRCRCGWPWAPPRSSSCSWSPPSTPRPSSRRPLGAGLSGGEAALRRPDAEPHGERRRRKGHAEHQLDGGGDGCRPRGLRRR